MRWFKNLKIAAKLIISFILVSMIAGTVGTIGFININQINNADTQLYSDNTLGISNIGKAAIYYQRIRFNTVKMMLDDSAIDESMQKISNYTQEVNNYLDQYNGTTFTGDDKKLFDDLSKNWEEYSAYITSITDDIKNKNADQAKELIFGVAQDSADQLQSSFDAIFDYNTNAAKVKSDSNSALARTSSIMMIIVIAVGVILAILLGIFISGIISRPVNEIVRAAEQLSLGNVNIDIKSDTKDELGKLMETFGRMIASIRGQALAVEKIADGDLTIVIDVRSEQDLLGKKLTEMVEKNNEILHNISNASEQVASGAKQISDSSMALSQGATEQASSVEELTASLEEISTQTNLNAQNANKANELAEIAKQNAIEGNAQMKDMQKAMEEINESSSSISKIIKVIDEIAFQTNILALNAAVEAARAGQHGKGFAVVAEEVRNLAARSASAASETTEMIEGSIKKVEVGTRIANVTAAALNKIVEDVSRAALLVNDIATASNEQALGISQINQGIMQVSQVVQTNSATSEETAAASEELSSQSELLNDTVKRFKLKKAGMKNMPEAIHPDILRLLENMSDNSRDSKSSDEKNPDAALLKPKILLSDKEFGKY
ncbi:MAG TPA: HAMP domain-containing methyl-accepting chemotaxis protein [Mobilitalea sp.]|nr:HAMP domain-containing methyl-accepting chemotaxis protein [Mobilitalea sp.]